MRRIGWLATCLSMMPMSAMAQQAESGADGIQEDAGEIVVTAQKRSESINDVGLAVQAFTGDDLREAGVTTTSDLSQVVSGFNFSRSNANTPIYTLRGVGFQTPNLSSTSPVGIYVDEVVYAYPYMGNGPTYDLERVEVLKGPQGTLYGRNTTGGLVNMITAKPTNILGAGGTIELGNYKTYNAEAFVNVPLMDDLSLRAAGRSENSDEGWQKSVTRDDRLGRKDRLAARATLQWKPDDLTTVVLGASWWRDKSDTVAPQASALDLARPATAIPGLAATVRTDWKNDQADWDPAEPGKPPFRTDSSFYSLTGRLDYRLSPDMTFTSLTAYNRVRRRDFNDLDGTPFELLAYGSNGKISSFSQEMRLSGDTPALQWLVGAFVAKDTISDDQLGFYDDNSTVRLLRRVGAGVRQTIYTQEQIAGGFRNFVNVTRQVNRSASILGNLEWQVADAVKLIGGLRYSDDRISFGGCSRDYEGNTRPIWNTAVAALTRSNTNVGVNECLTYNANFTDNTLALRVLHQDNVSGRLGVNYEPNRDLLFYGSVARGFKAGAFPVLPANVETQFEPSVQERLTAYEAGIKATLADRQIQLNLSAYYYEYKDKQIFGDVQDPVFTTLSRIVNVPKSRVLGAEAEMTWRVAPVLRLQSSVSFVDTKILDFVGINRSGQLEDFQGERFPNTPKWQVNGQAIVDQPIGSAYALTSTISASYQSAATGAVGVGDEYRIKPFTVVNLTLGVRDAEDRYRVGVYARNLFNVYYWSTVDTVIDTIFRVPAMPRTYGVTGSIRF